MPVHNGAVYLHQAVESILAQTFDGFEFLIVDDGSTDCTWQILNEYKSQDRRVCLMRNQSNMGYTKTLNKALDFVRGQFVARQDADDVSMPERLASQVDYLRANPKVGLLGSAYCVIDEHDQQLDLVELPCLPEDVHRALLDYNCVCHGSVMFRRECIKRVGVYRPQLEPSEDYDLWLRIAERFSVANLGDFLYRYRFTSGSVSVSRLRRQVARARLAQELNRMRCEHGEEKIDLDTIAPDLLDALYPAEPMALAGRYMHYAYLAYVSGDEKGAKAHFVNVLDAASSLHDAEDRLSQWLLGHSRLVTKQMNSVASGVRFVKTLLSGKSRTGVLPSRLQRRVLAEFHITAAFENYAQGQMSLVRRHLVAALWNDRRWLRNRGVLSIGVRSMIGLRAPR